jgi:hypothetical protein
MANVELSVVEGTVTALELSVPGVQGPPGEGIPSGGTVNQVLVKTSSADYDAEWSEVTSAMLGPLEIVNADIAANAAIADTKLATISTAGKVSNNATTANSANAALAIVARDNNGNFSAGTITANLTGNASTVTTNANLTGDVVSVGNATSIAAGVIVNADINASAAIADTKLATISAAGKVSNSATTATSANTASAIVARDASGNFSAGTITAGLIGNVTGNLMGPILPPFNSVSLVYSGGRLIAASYPSGISYDYASLTYSGDSLVQADYKTGGDGGTIVARYVLAYSGSTVTGINRTL